MELKHVKIFALAAELCNFSKVAEISFLSQSSVSKYIQTLEDELGGELFHRDGRKTELSEFGKAFLPYALSLLEKEDESREVLRCLKNGENRSVVHIGAEDSLQIAPASTFYSILMAAINDVRTRHPNAYFDIRYAASGELMELLSERRVDLVLRLLSNKQVANIDQGDKNAGCRCLDLCSNYLAVAPDADTTGGYLGVFSRTEIYTFAGEPLPQNVAFAASNQFGLVAGTKVYRNWMEMFLDVTQSHGRKAMILPGNMLPTARACGLQILEMDGFDLRSGMYAFTRPGNEDPYLTALMDSLKKSYDLRGGDAGL